MSPCNHSNSDHRSCNRRPTYQHLPRGAKLHKYSSLLPNESMGKTRAADPAQNTNQSVLNLPRFQGHYVKSVHYTDRPDPPSRPFGNKEQACQWVSSFVDWYNHQHRHSGIKFVTPQQRHCGEAIEICRHRAQVYEQARQRHPRRWTGAPRCWHQPEVVWINPPADDFVAQTATLALGA